MSQPNLTEDLNIVANSNIEITLLDGDLNIIQKLDDEPNDVGGLTAAELKAKFDEAGNIIKTYINGTLIPAVLAADATEEARAAAEDARANAEAERQSAEEARGRAESTRQSNEEARESHEAARVAAENARVNTESAREQAESGRVTAEEARVAAESLRASAEELRASAEQARAASEQNRATAEQNRASAEENRVKAEQTRVDAETARDTAEQERVAAETARADETAGIVEQATEQAGIAKEASGKSLENMVEAAYIARVLRHGQLPTDLPTHLILEADDSITYSNTDSEPYTIPTVAKSLELGRRYQVLTSGHVSGEFLWTGSAVTVGKSFSYPNGLVRVSGEMAYDQNTYRLTIQNTSSGAAAGSGRTLNITLRAADSDSLPAAYEIAEKAADSAAAASASEANAKDSETAAKASEEAAKASEIAAKESETTAKSEADRAKSEADRAAGIVGGEYATKSEVATAKQEAISAATAASRPSTWTPSKSEVGLGNVDNVKQYSANNPPPYPVASVNGMTGNVTIKPKCVTVTLSSSGWDSTAKTQTVTVTGVSATETAQMITPTPALASQTAYYDAGILCTGQAANSLTFTANTIPTADLTVYVVIQEVGE